MKTKEWWPFWAMLAVAIVALCVMYDLTFGAVPPVGKMLETNHDNLSAQESLGLYQAKQDGHVPVYVYLKPDPDGAIPKEAGSPVPEPVTMVLVGTGLLVIGLARRKRRGRR